MSDEILCYVHMLYIRDFTHLQTFRRKAAQAAAVNMSAKMQWKATSAVPDAWRELSRRLFDSNSGAFSLRRCCFTKHFGKMLHEQQLGIQMRNLPMYRGIWAAIYMCVVFYKTTIKFRINHYFREIVFGSMLCRFSAEFRWNVVLEKKEKGGKKGKKRGKTSFSAKIRRKLWFFLPARRATIFARNRIRRERTKKVLGRFCSAELLQRQVKPTAGWL